MKKPKDKSEFLTQLNQAKQQYTRRDQLVLLCKEMYALKKNYKSGYLGADATKWRTKVPSQYWESDNRPQNVVDVMTAVLAGNQPQWKISIPGDTISTLPTRGEKFLSGVWRLNSRRQQVNLFNYLVFRTALDGGAGIRIYWDTEAPAPTEVKSVDLPDNEGITAPLALYGYDNFPIVIEIVPIDRLYPVGRGRMGKPFDEIFHVEERTPYEVQAEWKDVDGADTKWISEYTKKEQTFQKFEYIEWWAETLEGEIWYACLFDKRYVIEPKQVDYPAIPYVLTTFKLADRDTPELERIPFLFPIIWSTQRKDYLRSRNFRLADLFGNMPPITRGDNPVNLQGTWGDSINLGPEDSIEFPRWPGNPPDIHKMVEDAAQSQAEGTFSPAMFGQVSSRMSGYALSQLVGSDTLRVDTPKTNIEMALGLVADIIFGLLRKFSPGVYRGINMDLEKKFPGSDPINEGERLLKAGKLKTVITIPRDFTKKVRQGRKAEVGVIIDGSDSNVANLVYQYNERIINGFVSEIQPVGRLFNVGTKIFFNPELKSAYFFIPGLVAILLMMISAILTSISITREKESGSIDLIFISPLKTVEILIGKTIPYIVVALMVGAAILVFARFWFGIPFRGSLLVLFIFSILYIFAGLSMGIMISTVTSSQKSAMFAALLATLLPSIMLSGFIFPLASMPKPLQIISHIVPARYFLNIIRGVAVKGAELKHFLSDGLALIIFSFVLMTIAGIKFSKNRKKVK